MVAVVFIVQRSEVMDIYGRRRVKARDSIGSRIWGETGRKCVCEVKRGCDRVSSNTNKAEGWFKVTQALAPPRTNTLAAEKGGGKQGHLPH